MIIKEQFYVGDRAFTRVRSNTGRYVVREGISYISACDPVEFDREYVEGEVIPQEPIPEQSATTEDYEDALRRLGVET